MNFLGHNLCHDFPPVTFVWRDSEPTFFSERRRISLPLLFSTSQESCQTKYSLSESPEPDQQRDSFRFEDEQVSACYGDNSAFDRFLLSAPRNSQNNTKFAITRQDILRYHIRRYPGVCLAQGFGVIVGLLCNSPRP